MNTQHRAPFAAYWGAETTASSDGQYFKVGGHGEHTDHVFALCHAPGLRFAPRIRDLADKRLYVPDDARQYPALARVIGGTINTKLILAQWPELQRLVASIAQGTVTASLMLCKLASYPRKNSLALALREPGRIQRALFTLDWVRDPALRQQVPAGLNKSEAKFDLLRQRMLNAA